MIGDRSKNSSKSNNTGKLPNREIVVLAAYLIGGHFRYIDTEDIAIKSNEIAPGRFSWRKYKDQINIDTVRKRLWDATKPDNGGHLVGSEKEGWLLTKAGRVFADSHVEHLEKVDLSKTRLSTKEQAWLMREKQRMLGETAYQIFSDGNLDEISAIDAERFYRIDDYVTGAARKLKVERATNLLGHDPDVGEAVRELVKFVRDI